MWFQILSELFINLSAGWFGLVLIENQFNKKSSDDVLGLILRILIGIISLFIAKLFREKAEQK